MRLGLSRKAAASFARLPDEGVWAYVIHHNSIRERVGADAALGTTGLQSKRRELARSISGDSHSPTFCAPISLMIRPARVGPATKKPQRAGLPRAI